MALKLMYITNDPAVATIAQAAGTDQIFVDLEYIGKSQRQGGMDTVQSHHTVDDVARLRKVLTSSELMVRVNPIHEGSAREIDAVAEAGADQIMLPYFKTVGEAETFLRLVDGRTKTMLLVETPEAVAHIEDIVRLGGIDRIHIGLNDLSLGYKMKFMFQLLADGTVDRLCSQFRQANIPYGFGGIAGLGRGAVPAEMVIKEHYRLGSTCAILSRSFCNSLVLPLDRVAQIFEQQLPPIRQLEAQCAGADKAFFDENRRAFLAAVEGVLA